MSPAFGPLLNVPEKPYRCPSCGDRDCRVSVYVRAAVRDCGFVVPLNPIGPSHRSCRRKDCAVCHD